MISLSLVVLSGLIMYPFFILQNNSASVSGPDQRQRSSDPCAVLDRSERDRRFRTGRPQTVLSSQVPNVSLFMLIYI